MIINNKKLIMCIIILMIKDNKFIQVLMNDKI